MSTCPVCGCSGLIIPLAPNLYRCTNWKCKAEYSVQHNRCQRCNDEIEDDRTFCEFHRYLGDDPPRSRREDFCILCGDPAQEGTEYCTACHEERNRERT